MDDRRFDALSRAISHSASRRATLRLLAGGALISLLARLTPDATAAQEATACRPLGKKCQKGDKCCGGGRCKGGRCKCTGGTTRCSDRCIPPPSQTPGDCQRKACDGQGGTTSIADNSDLPVDGNDCTDDFCTGGVPSNPAKAAGASCSQNGGTMCDGAGQCVSCLTPADCSGQVPECQMRTCTGGVCGVTFAAAGTPCTGGTCDGFGNCSP